MKGILLAIVIIGRAYCEVVEDVDDTPMEEVYEDDSDSPSIDFSSLTPLPLDGSSSSGSSVLKPDIQAQSQVLVYFHKQQFQKWYNISKTFTIQVQVLRLRAVRMHQC
eukprot:TRINITY_DN5448_c0_g1_i1.p6 TRINITY_DN5448_c0_g1~~TRINITY_DN5448_c0_g1_i1.p6  ORF type:complete len:126 (-),score=7.20 TRINITY_DN5448_c0_g1_i1:1530-1853(-)